jgi:hypothetical protein
MQRLYTARAARLLSEWAPSGHVLGTSRLTKLTDATFGLINVHIYKCSCLWILRLGLRTLKSNNAIHQSVEYHQPLRNAYSLSALTYFPGERDTRASGPSLCSI